MFSNFLLGLAFKHTLFVVGLMLIANLQTMAAPKEAATFIPVGFLDGDDASLVYAVDDAVTVAGCYSYHRDPNNFMRVFSYAARWTPGDGMQPLPRLSNTSNGQNPPLSFAGARDVSSDGSRVAFSAPTDDLTARASAISDPDGSNLIELTSLPDGDKLQVVNQLSDDGLTAFGYSLDDSFLSGFIWNKGAIWTSSGGVMALTPTIGFDYIEPAARAISSDGKVSAGDLVKVDPSSGALIDQQAYRWTSTGGVMPIGFLPGGDQSTSVALSNDGTTILGLSNKTSGTDDGPDTFFLWNGGTKTDLGVPQYDAFGTGTGGAGISATGDLILVAAGGYSFIRRQNYDYYFRFEDILEQAGAGSMIVGWSRFSVTGMSDDGNTLFGQATDPDGKGEGFIATFTPDFLRGLTASPPEITSLLTATANLNDPYTYAITASGAPESFGAEDLPPGFTLETGTSQPGNLRVGIISGTPTAPGIYSIPISATNVAGTANAVLTLTVTYAEFVPRLLNISTRAEILTDDKVLIAGFIIPVGGPKKVILRAIGPSLAEAGLTGLLDDPVLELHSPDGNVVANDNWQDSQKEEIEATGYAPSNDRESALVATLDPGSYTVVITGKKGTSGIGLVEAYDLDDVVVSQMGNLSTRGFIDSGDNVLIGGITIGSTSQPQIVVRAIGPSLADLGVPGAMADPVLEIHGADGSMLFSNDNWRDSQESDLEAVGYAPADDHESAILATLPPAQYTAIVRGKDDTTGVGLVEVYNLSQ
jgi:hypothetical protein